MMQLNYMGCVHAAKAVAGEMLGRDSGHMCFVSSAMGLLGGWRLLRGSQRWGAGGLARASCTALLVQWRTGTAQGWVQCCVVVVAVLWL